jgi:hypothetical protein
MRAVHAIGPWSNGLLRPAYPPRARMHHLPQSFGPRHRRVVTEHHTRSITRGRSALSGLPRSAHRLPGRPSLLSRLDALTRGADLGAGATDRPKALAYFAEALQSDVSDIQGGTTARVCILEL